MPAGTDLLLLLLFVGMDACHALMDGRGWWHGEWNGLDVPTVTEQIFGRAAS